MYQSYLPEGQEPLSTSPEKIQQDYVYELAGLVAIGRIAESAAQESAAQTTLLHFLDDIQAYGRIMHTYTERCGWDRTRLTGLQGKAAVDRLDAIAITLNEAYRARIITAQFINHMYAQVQSILFSKYS